MENSVVQLSNSEINKVDNEEEGPIDFGIEPTTTLPTPRRPIAPRNKDLIRKKEKSSCCGGSCIIL